MHGADDPGDAGARAVLAAGVLAGLAYLAYVALWRPSAVALDYRVYHAAGEAVLAGRRVYGVDLVAGPVGSYYYAPVTLPAFAALALLPLRVGFAVWTAVTVAAGLALAWLLVRVTERHVALSRVDHALIAAFVLLSVHAAPSLVYGQTNHLVALALAAGFVLAASRPWSGGASFAGAAAVKAFPAVAGVWLLRRRAYAALGAAVASGLGLLVAGLALGPARTRRYVTEAMVPRFLEGSADVAPGADLVTLRRPLAALFPGHPLVVSAGAVLLVVPVVAYLYRDLSGPRDRLVAVYGILAATLLALPSLVLYLPVLYFPLVVLLYVLDGRARALVLAGTALTLVSLRLPDLRRLLALAGADVPAPVAAAFGVATPPLLGLLLTLAGCVAYRRRSLSVR